MDQTTATVKANGSGRREHHADLIQAAKVSVPVLRQGIVHRPRLVERLAQCVRYRLAVVSAAAGSGKTTLLTEWRTSQAATDLAVAWVSLGPADDDPARFFKYVAIALEKARRGAGATALAHLRNALGVTTLRGVDGFPEPPSKSMESVPNVVLVLDDYHFIRTPAIHDAVASILSSLHSWLHVIVATRTSPSLPLSRLRARGELLEIHADQLRFTIEEGTAFLEDTAGLCLPSGVAEVLVARTEGWCAGMQLAAASVQEREEPARWLADFTGSQRLVFDFLGEEVFQHEPSEVQEFLLSTSILERLSGRLCDAVLGEGRSPGEARSQPGAGAGDGTSQRMLERLERENLFVISLDEERRWWRYHPLFGEFLRRRLEEERPAEIPELRRRAARWLEANGFTEEATGHAIAIQDFEKAAQLIEASYLQWDATASPPSRLLYNIHLLPKELQDRPQLQLAESWALLSSGQAEIAEKRIREAVRSAPQDRSLAAGARLLRAYAAVWRGEPRQTICLLNGIHRQFSPRDTWSRMTAEFCLGLAYQTLENDERAERYYQRVRTLAKADAGPEVVTLPHTLNQLSDMEADRGKLRKAARFAEEALRLASHSGHDLPWACISQFRLGLFSYEWNDLDSAARYFGAAIENGTRVETTEMPVLASLFLAFVRRAQGDLQSAARLAMRAEQIVQQQRMVAPFVMNIARIMQTRLSLWLGDFEAAAHWMETRSERAPGVFPQERHLDLMCWARVMLALGRADEVIAPLQRSLRRARKRGYSRWVLELEVMLTLALAARGDTKAAQAMLNAALDQAQPEGWTRLFIDEGQPMAHLLEDAVRRRSPHFAYARGLLAAMAGQGNRSAVPAEQAQHGHALIEPLRKRELEILSLIADGLPNSEIANRLFISVATVKTHINNLYGKLGARSRTDAVARARRMGMV